MGNQIVTQDLPACSAYAIRMALLQGCLVELYTEGFCTSNFILYLQDSLPSDVLQLHVPSSKVITQGLNIIILFTYFLSFQVSLCSNGDY